MKKKKWPKSLLIISAILLAIVVGAVILYHYLFGGIKHVTLDKNELGIEENYYDQQNAAANEAADSTEAGTTAPGNENITAGNGTTTDDESSSDSNLTHEIKNIVIFGMSISQEGGIDTDRSDMNLVVSIDQDNNRVCLTSILRDSKVPIEGHDPQKINAAYKYGGATLAIKTINQNFHLNISDYITINFEGLINLVDVFGGVDIELTADEAARVSGAHEGLNTLTGDQAKSYASIRYIDSDYYRASRQQTVILALLDKIKNISKDEYPGIVSKVTSCIETSLTDSQIWSIINSIDISTVKIVQNTIPDYDYEEGLWGGIDDTGSWVYVYDLDAAAERIHRIIYEGSEDGAEPEAETTVSNGDGAVTEETVAVNSSN